jgi:hypothetical protein
MRHQVSKDLGKAADQNKALTRALVTEVLRHGKIKTTVVSFPFFPRPFPSTCSQSHTATGAGRSVTASALHLGFRSGRCGRNISSRPLEKWGRSLSLSPPFPSPTRAYIQPGRLKVHHNIISRCLVCISGLMYLHIGALAR